MQQPFSKMPWKYPAAWFILGVGMQAPHIQDDLGNPGFVIGFLLGSVAAAYGLGYLTWLAIGPKPPT